MKLPEETARDDSEAAAPPDWLNYIAEPRHAWPILLIFGVALDLVNLGGYPLYTKGEPREAVTVFDIVHGGGVLLPQRAGVEIPSKPLLMHWLAALVSLVAGGVNEFSVRLPSAGLAIAGVIVCYFYVRRLFDDVTALIAALILGTTFQYLQAATGARVDMTLTFFMEVAFFEFLLMAEGMTRRRMLLYVAIALAVLTKGPIGLILPGLVALIWIALERRWTLLREMNLVRGALVVLVLAGGWYLAALIEGGPEFFRKQILTENLLRFSGGGDFHEGHIHPFYYMELALFAGFMPWTILLPIVGVQAARAPLAVDPRLKYIFVWFTAVLIFYNLPQSKRGVYLLCMYPAFATIIAIYVRQAIMRPAPARTYVHWIARFSGFAMLMLGSAALVTLAMLVASPGEVANLLQAASIRAPAFTRILISTVGEHWMLALALPLLVVVLGVRLIVTRPLVERTVLAIAAAMVFVTVAVNVVVVPAIANTLSLKDFTDRAMKVVDNSPVGYLNALNYDVAFYSRRTIPIVSQRDPDMPQYLIAWRALFDSLPATKRDRFDIMMTSNPTSLDGTDEMLLLRQRPSSPTPKPSDDYIQASARLNRPNPF
ncbi:MAG TPA: glycosyltransferase family 39 protein [Candidatus Binatus sp.]|uniref:ArnT family glycosyltransferase n=1 Tax=Candidatus Binatus sp. TaxID=2811406 RepID=UPI002B481F30|nr:glycosyltransferase family 39 protein [Candidatus Binatus sp.]HKN12613.1 glycosyltransferase family 39 protein [Candidatus Binatus sp.]